MKNRKIPEIPDGSITHLALDDPWLYEKIKEGEIPKEYQKHHGGFPMTNAKIWYRFIKDKIDESIAWSVDRDGETCFSGSLGVIFFPKGDRFFIQIKDPGKMVKTFYHLLSKYPTQISYIPTCELIQFLQK